MNNKSNWNTYKFRKWDLENTGISVNPDYNDKDLLGFKKGSQHFHTRFKMFKRIG